jgi:addiction module HigA family antidote
LIGVPVPRINAIVLGQRAITPDTAIRLAKYFGTSAQFWLNLQLTYELEVALNRADYSRIPTLKQTPSLA